MTYRIRLAALSLFVIAPLVGCGGGGGGSGDVTVNLVSVAPIDGIVDSDGSTIPILNTVSTGDTAANVSRRGFVRFDLTSLPPGAVVTQALLHVHQSVVAGAPYATLGSVFVDHIDIGAALDASDYASVAFTANIGILSSDALLGYKTLDVTSAVLADLLATRTTSDFRLHHLSTTDSDSSSDTVQFDDGEDTFATGNVPLLEVVYH